MSKRVLKALKKMRRQPGRVLGKMSIVVLPRVGVHGLITGPSFAGGKRVGLRTGSGWPEELRF